MKKVPAKCHRDYFIRSPTCSLSLKDLYLFLIVTKAESVAADLVVLLDVREQDGRRVVVIFRYLCLTRHAVLVDPYLRELIACLRLWRKLQVPSGDGPA